MNLSINLWYPPTLLFISTSFFYHPAISHSLSHTALTVPAPTPYLYDKTVLGQCSNLPTRALLVRVETLTPLCSRLTQNPWTQR